MAQTPTGRHYIGITNDLIRRQAQHGARFVQSSYVQLRLPPMNYATAKGVEQYLIGIANTAGVNMANAINSVSAQSSYYLNFLQRGMLTMKCHDLTQNEALRRLGLLP